MCYIQVKNIRLNSFYEEKKIKLCLTKQPLNMFKLWCEWGIRKVLKGTHRSSFFLVGAKDKSLCSSLLCDLRRSLLICEHTFVSLAD